MSLLKAVEKTGESSFLIFSYYTIGSYVAGPGSDYYDFNLGINIFYKALSLK
jgi:hypothetical protein